VALFVPTFTQFIFHWKPGIGPPLTAVATNVTGVPKQHGLHETDMEIETGNGGLTVIEMEFDVAGLPEEQLRSEETWQVTASPFAGL